VPELRIQGGGALHGAVVAEGAKNAVLPCLAAALLTDSPIELRRVPALRDVEIMAGTIDHLGKRVRTGRGVLSLQEGDALRVEAPHELVRQMRATFLVLGPVVARKGHAVVPLPGGCTIGPRPVDLHLQGLRQLGARVVELDGAVEVCADRLTGAAITLRYPSVGATEQLLMAGSLAHGTTTIRNAAQEPEVHDLARLLRAMGADIESTVDGFVIRGQRRLGSATHTVIPDRIEAATFLCAAGATAGEITVRGVLPEHLGAVLEVLHACGADVVRGDEEVTIRFDRRPRATEIVTGPYPAVPTDVQPPLSAMLSVAEGESRVRDAVFPERYAYASELRLLGAEISVHGDEAAIRGVPHLDGRSVAAPDLRGGAALVIAGLAARGTTVVSGTEHLDRGYTLLVEKLTQLGAHVER
jgi:UDP-N-acetylglucosamine 1-carboxyvinyltransferase